ncbi:MAG: glycosyltransferase family 2 protein [Polaromonas sp.]|nr:glycosyltransferase family 2 protein [Polaromonas sp.]
MRSVLFADQIVVLDSGSTDETVNIAKRLGAEVEVNTQWAGFGVQKNRALALATGEWVLSIDADERLTPELQAEIQAVLRNPQAEAYGFPRLSSYCKRYIHHSGWYPDRVIRLFQRGTARFSDVVIHEKLIVKGRVSHLEQRMLHESFQDFETVLDKVNRYSSAGAMGMLHKGKSSSFPKALGHGLWAFIRTYFLQMGFLDGWMGLALAISNAEGTYYRYLKLWLLLDQKSASASS